ncbi:MAG TPA: malectin domain-containing carbohydrate-binding protein [Terriglobales bacterium]
MSTSSVNEISPAIEEQKQELVRRVLASSTFEKSVRLRAFLLYVCRCAFENKPEEATEQQIGIHVYGRLPGYNPNEDNIVRSQARVLRSKLEHYFANQGKNETTVITIPKGRYLPVFEAHFPVTLNAPSNPSTTENKQQSFRRLLLVGAVTVVLAILVGAYFSFRAKSQSPGVAAPSTGSVIQPEQDNSSTTSPAPVSTTDGELRIAAGHMGEAFVDSEGRRWESDHYYNGGVIRQGPKHFFPPVTNETLFKTMREAPSADRMVPQSQREFSYDIPLRRGSYELQLYFADPIRQLDSDTKEDAQNHRHFQVDVNGHPILTDFDPISDEGAGAVDVRTFKDINPAEDGKLHLKFSSVWETPPFVSGIVLRPGTSGRMNPIRIAAHPKDFIDHDGIRWSGDQYYIDGNTSFYQNSDTGPKVPALYAGERLGNFSYAIPVPPGSYTIKLYFLESFFSTLIPAAPCQGIGCRVFDVTCNGVMLLHDFDIIQAAPGAFQPMVREFHNLRPNGQGKLLISFSPRANYAEVRAIEVLDEAK